MKEVIKNVRETGEGDDVIAEVSSFPLKSLLFKWVGYVVLLHILGLIKQCRLGFK